MVLLQNARGYSGIGSAGDLDIMQIVVNSVASFDHEREGTHTCAAGADERSVDVEKQQSFGFHKEKLSADYADVRRLN